MPRKPRKGYFVKGQFVAEGSELDLELKRALKGDTPEGDARWGSHGDGAALDASSWELELLR